MEAATGSVEGYENQVFAGAKGAGSRSSAVHEMMKTIAIRLRQQASNSQRRKGGQLEASLHVEDGVSRHVTDYLSKSQNVHNKLLCI